MVTNHILANYCNKLLNAEQFADYCPNGLQIEGRHAIKRIITGVSANLALINAAI